ncbi:hypothetical protein KR044_011655 [Drosophila immigrans]|nr:hypothetical protein KR044_011655 [Drosophila immigrans]
MNNNNLQQWWENTYRRQQQLQPTFDNHININIVGQSGNETPVLRYTLIDENYYGGAQLTSRSVYDFDYENYGNLTLITPYDIDNSADSEHTIPSITILMLAISYGLVVFGGVVGNSTFVLTLCSASSVRLRNPLLLGVVIADLLVTGISAPVTLLNLAMNRGTRSLPILLCKLIHFVQIMPVAASTISFFMLSLDRYATVKHPRLAQLRRRRYLHVSLAMLSWITSAVISMPFLFAYKIIAKSVVIKGASTSTTPSSVNISCTSELGANVMFMSFIIFHTIVVFVLPGIGVLLNHYGVRRKLCALSLTARAAHGELPLPMPILRRQTHMVIVTGCANAQQAACGGVTTVDDTSNGNGNVEGQFAVSPGDIQLHNLKPGSSAALEPGSYRSSNPISPRAMREIRAHSQRQRIPRSSRGPATPGMPLPQTSTLRSRRHLANMLVASALIFIVCWAPHVFCVLYKNFGYKQYCSKASIYFSLLLGYFYSAISPVIYWALNNNSLRQSPCAPIIRLRSMQNFLRSRFRSHTVPPAASSTNEAALGAFNPKLIKLTPKQYRAQASSHYLY